MKKIILAFTLASCGGTQVEVESIETPVVKDAAPVERKLFFVDKGEGQAVILLHGADDKIENTFDNQIEVIANSGFRVIFPHRAGRGKSEAYAGKITVSKDSADILSMMNDLEIEKAILVGHSGGAQIAKDLYSKHPERVSAIVSIDSAAFAKFGLPFFRTLDVARYDAEDFEAYSRNAEALAEMHRVGDYPSDFNLNLLIGVGSDTASLIYSSDGDDESDGDLCAVPILAIVSGRGLIQETDSEALTLIENNPCLEIKVITKAGHYVHEERPVEFNDELSKFLWNKI